MYRHDHGTGTLKGSLVEEVTRPALQDAAEAIRLVQAQPRAARSLALSALERARSPRDPEAASMAHRALGLVAKEETDLRTARQHLATAVRVARSGNLPVREAEARMSLALVLANLGKTAGALAELEAAEASLDGPAKARLRVQRALVLQHQDRAEEALLDYRYALPVLRKAGDQLWEMRALLNRGVLRTNRGEFGDAERDLLAALELCRKMEFGFGAGLAQHGLGYLLARKGDVVAALDWYERAEDLYRAAGVRHPTIQFDRGELLLSARLVAEARTASERAVRELSRGGMALRLAEARLMLSQAALLDGDLETARTAADQARRAFTRQRRPGWAALARYEWLRAAWAAGDRAPATLSAALRTASDLRDAKWTVKALEARILAARIALECGRVDVASRELTAAGRARHRGPAELRSRAWHATALLSLAKGERHKAEAALNAGMDILDQHRAALGATELRAHYSAHGADLALSGLRLALKDGDAERVFQWAERWRAGALRARPVRPPDDPGLLAELAELRLVVKKREDAALQGDETAALLRRQAALEDAVRRRTRRVAGAGAADDCAMGPSARALGEALGDRALVEITELDGRLYAVVVTSEGARLRELGASGAADFELEALHFALRRLARGQGGSASTGAALAAVAHGGKRLDSLLLEPLAADLGDHPLVIAPTGTLHATPWSLLPSCRGRAVSVTPCAALWHAATMKSEKRGATGPVVLVAGPNLPHAAEEVARLSQLYPDAVRLVGEKAGAQAVLAALDRAALAHVAAHGTFRGDNPLFSALELADGPVTVYDLESLQQAPKVLLLSACKSGLSAVQPGDELMGLAASLLSLGTRTLIASVVDVPDEHTADLMLGVHRLLRAGAPPAEALCKAQAETDSSDPLAVATSAAFICFGAT